MNPFAEIACKLDKVDWEQTIFALRELAALKHDELVQTNASDRDWDKVTDLQDIATTLEFQLLSEALK